MLFPVAGKEDPMRIVRWKAEAVTYALLLAGFGYLYWLTFSFGKSLVRGYPGAAFFPRLILYFTIGATLAALTGAVYCSVASKRKTADSFVFEAREFTLTVLAIGAFIALLPILGFELTTLITMFALLVVRLGGWLQAFVVAVIAMVVCYGLFVLMLNVSLPLRFLPAHVTFF